MATTRETRKASPVSVGTKAIIVLAMHRSGSSALTRVLNLLGAQISSNLMPPVPGNNETGFWESSEFHSIHEEMFASAGAAWDDVSAFPERWYRSDVVKVFRKKIVEILRQDFKCAPLFIVKDPRICRFVPFWVSVLKELDAQPNFIILVRSPLEVAMSLKARDEFHPSKSLLLWLGYLLDAERDSRGYKRSFVSYESLLKDWRATAERISTDLRIGWPRASDQADTEIEEFLSIKLRRNEVALEEFEARADVVSWVKEAYVAALEAVAGNGQQLSDIFDHIRAELETADVAYGPLIALGRLQLVERDAEIERLANELRERDAEIERLANELRERDAEIERLANELRERDAEIERLANELGERDAEIEALNKRLDWEVRARQEILDSTSWRMTAPARWTSARVRRAFRWASACLRNVGIHFRWRTHEITLKAVHQIKVENGKFRSTGTDPQFWLQSSRRSLPCGWVLLTYTGGVKDQPLTPELHVDEGHGLAEGTTIRLRVNLAGVTKHVIRLPDRVVALRFDPMDSPGEFSLEHVKIHELGKIQLVLILLWPRLKPALIRPWRLLDLVSNTVDTLRSGGLERVKNRLLGPAEYVDSTKQYHSWVFLYDSLSDADRESIRRRVDTLPYKPTLSILMPVYNTPEKWLRLAVDSVRRQLYPHWELCIADDASSEAHIRRVLEEFRGWDPRIKVVFRNENGHIAAASNSALEIAEGEFLILLDHDDTVPEHALYMVAEELNRHPDADLIYSDEDKIDEYGQRHDPYFKPDWNPDLFYSHNLISHLGVYRTSLVKEIGGFREGYEGSQDYDLALRVIEKTSPDCIRHIPHVLYHWRAIPGSVALGSDQKIYAHESARKAIRSHFERLSISVEVIPASDKSSQHRVVYHLPKDLPLVSLIIPTKDKVDLLRGCVDGILNKTDYRNMELIIVDNRSVEAKTLTYLEELQQNSHVRVLKYDAPYNFSAINNMAVRRSRGEVIALINNDLEVISAGWLTEMVSHALRPGIGAVGARLFYPDDTIQHAGVVVGIGGVAVHVHNNNPRDFPGYAGRAQLIQNFSAVTAACMVMRREVFEEVGGLDEKNLWVAFNDVDLCLRIRERGYRILWTPYAELYHLEGASRGRDTIGNARFAREIKYMKARWGDVLLNDPCYSPNLSLDHPDFSLAFPPRVSKPWKYE